jgi:hypothetical protein
MKNPKNVHIISSTLRTIASENLVTEDEILNAQDKPLQEILNEVEKKNKNNIQESGQTQTENS